MKTTFYFFVAATLMATFNNPAFAQCTPAGNPTVFGDHVWNQYVWNSINWTDNYAGYDVFTDLDYNSESHWNALSNPASSTTYQGCALSGNDNFSWSIKRQGFDAGTYSISILQHDDAAQLYVNGVLVWSDGGCCVTYNNVWTGELNSTTTVEFRVEDNNDLAVGQIEITAPCIPPGDPAVFGDHVWNFYAWNGLNWNDHYSGYTPGISPDEIKIDHTSGVQILTPWSYNLSPSNVSNFQGCGVNNDTFTYSYKRKGFSADFYTIGFGASYDHAEVYVNGELKFTGGDYKPIGFWYTGLAWSGCLNDSSTVEIRGKTTEGQSSLFFALWAMQKILSTGPQTICPGFSETLTAPQGNSYLWSTGETTQSISINETATYSVTVLGSEGGCTVSDSYHLNVQPMPTPTPVLYGSNPYSECSAVPQIGISNFSAGNNYSWSNGMHGNVITPAGPGDYRVIATDALGCVSDTSTILSLVSIPPPGDTTVYGDHQWNVYVHSDYSPQTTGCGGYCDVPGTSYYYGGYFTDSILNFNAEDHWPTYGNPSIVPGYQGCSIGDDHFHFNAMRQGFECGLYHVNIPVHDDDAYLYVNGVLVWSEAGTASTVSNVWTGLLNEDSKIEFKVYEITGESKASIELIPIQLFTPVTATISGPTLICGTNPITLDAGAGFSSYAWSTGSTAQTTSVYASGNYNVTVTDANGCVSTAQTNITTATVNTYYRDADIDTYGNPSISLSACSTPPGYVLNSTDCNDGNAAIHPGAADICNSIDDNCNGQTDENAITATISPDGIVNVCKGNAFSITANGGSGINYQWVKGNSNIAGATNQTYAPSKTGAYKVKETNSFSCASTSPVASVTIVNKPTATITALGNLNICSTGSVVLQASSGLGYTYQWMKGSANLVGATNQNYTATSKGTYKVVVSNSTGCSKTSNSLKVTKTCGKVMAYGGEGASADLVLYPNPSSGTFNIDLKMEGTGDSAFKLAVINMVGQTIYADEGWILNGTLQKEVSLPSLTAPGMYFVRISMNDSIYEEKLIIQ